VQFNYLPSIRALLVSCCNVRGFRVKRLVNAVIGKVPGPDKFSLSGNPTNWDLVLVRVLC